MHINAVACTLQRPTRACIPRFIAEIDNLLRNMAIGCSGRDSIVRINSEAWTLYRPARTGDIQIIAETKGTLMHYGSGQDSLVHMNAIAGAP